MERIAQSRSALRNLYDMSARSRSWSSLQSVWNTPINGVNPLATFTSLAQMGRFSPGTRIVDATKFAQSVINFHDKLNSLTINDENMISTIGRSKNVLLGYVGGGGVQQIGKVRNLQDLGPDTFHFPEEDESKYNPSGQAVTRFRPLKSQEARQSLPPLGVQIPFADKPYTMRYHPEAHKTGGREKKILRQSQLAQTPNRFVLPEDIKEKLLGIKKEIDKAQIPSPQDFVAYITNSDIPIEKRRRYTDAVLQRTYAVNQIIEDYKQNLLSDIGNQTNGQENG